MHVCLHVYIYDTLSYENDSCVVYLFQPSPIFRGPKRQKRQLASDTQQSASDSQESASDSQQSASDSQKSASDTQQSAFDVSCNYIHLV